MTSKIEKKVIFFSHSSLDKDFISIIKSRLKNITSDSVDIFQSSDGESIPFGSTWIHEVTEALKRAKLMLIFVTPNSIKSDWIYFEAGFGYAKKIPVIPIGIGIDIALLKPPLSQLQGFNIISHNGLNNIVVEINKLLKTKFNCGFTEPDFKSIVACQDGLISGVNLPDIFKKVICRIDDNLSASPFYKLNNLDVVDLISSHLKEKNIKFSYSNTSRLNPYLSITEISEKRILVLGLYISSDTEGISTISGNSPRYENVFKITISLYNFEKSFDLFLDLRNGIFYDVPLSLCCYFEQNFISLVAEADLSAVFATVPEDFQNDHNAVGWYRYLQYNLLFSINFDDKTKRYVLIIDASSSQVDAKSIIALVNNLLLLNVIQIVKT